MTKIYTAVSVACTCPFCAKVTELIVPARGYRLWQEGELIQNALPDLTATERETLISGLCESCQDSFFGDEDEDDWDVDEAIGEWIVKGERE